MKGENYLKQDTIVIKPGPGVEPVKRPGLKFYGSTRINPEIHSFFFLLKVVDNT
jgi:cobalamin biosynthesis protein CbiD